MIRTSVTMYASTAWSCRRAQFTPLAHTASSSRSLKESVNTPQRDHADRGGGTSTASQAAATTAFRAEVLRRALRERAEQEIVQRLGAPVKAIISAVRCPAETEHHWSEDETVKALAAGGPMLRARGSTTPYALDERIIMVSGASAAGAVVPSPAPRSRP